MYSIASPLRTDSTIRTSAVEQRGVSLVPTSRDPGFPIQVAPEVLAELALDVLAAFQSLARADALALRAEAHCLAFLQRTDGPLALGFSSFGDLVREVFQMTPRTARNHVALDRLFARSRQVEAAFLEGKLTPCQVLALRPVLTEENEIAWIQFARDRTVRELKLCVRAELKRNTSILAAASTAASTAMGTDPVSRGGRDADLDGQDLEDERGRTISFQAPLALAIAWDQALETARKLLGWEAPRYLCVQAILDEAAPEAIPDDSPDDSPDDPPGDSLGGFLDNSPDDPRDDSPDHSPTESHDDSPADSRAETPVERSCSISEDASNEDHSRQRSKARGPRSTSTNGAPHNLWSEIAGRLLAPDAQPIAVRPRALAAARDTLAFVRAQLEDLDRLVDPSDPLDPHDAADRLTELRLVRRPIRVLRGQLLRTLVQTRLLRFLGFHFEEDFAEAHLGVSPRTARSWMTESHLFEQHPELEDAFARGHLGLAQALLVRRVALRKDLAAHLERARQVTHRQLRREVRFLERLQCLDRDLWAAFTGPFPHRGLEPALSRELCARGWTRDRIEAELRARGVESPEDPQDWVENREDPGRRAGSAENQKTPAESQERSSESQKRSSESQERSSESQERSSRIPKHSADPAENRVQMERLETLLDLLSLEPRDVDGAESGRAESIRPKSRGSESGGPEWRRLESQRPEPRRPLIENAGNRQTFSSEEPSCQISFWAPEATARHWDRAIQNCRLRYDRLTVPSPLAPVSSFSPDVPHPLASRLPRLPIWAAATHVLYRAMCIWEARDPDCRPKEARILERDCYRCQVPGCSKRRHLQVHHIVFRSQGGGDEVENKITLCFRHHQHAIHRSILRVRGKAPGDLVWELGCRPGSRPFLVYRGEKLEGLGFRMFAP